MGRWITIPAAALVAGGLLILSAVSGAQAGCYDWSEARSIIERQDLVSVQEISRALRRRGEQPIRLDFCKTDGEFVYVMSVVGPDGHVREVTVNARNAMRNGARPRSDSFLASPIPSSPFDGRAKKRRRPRGFRRFLPEFMR